MTVEVHFQGSKKFLALESRKPRVIQPGGEELDRLIDASESLVVACDKDDKGGSIRMKSGFEIRGGESIEPSATRLSEGGTVYVERYNEVIARISHRPRMY